MAGWLDYVPHDTASGLDYACLYNTLLTSAVRGVHHMIPESLKQSSSNNQHMSASKLIMPRLWKNAGCHPIIRAHCLALLVWLDIEDSISKMLEKERASSRCRYECGSCGQQVEGVCGFVWSNIGPQCPKNSKRAVPQQFTSGQHKLRQFGAILPPAYRILHVRVPWTKVFRTQL